MTMATQSWSEYDLRKMECIKEFLKAYPDFGVPELDRAVREDNLVQAERLVKRIADHLCITRSANNDDRRRAKLRAVRPLVHQLIWQDMRAKVA